MRGMEWEEVRRDWEERSFSCGLWTDPPGQVWPDFVHAVDELVMLVEGKMALSFGGKTVRPALGEEILIPAGTKHTVENPGNTVNRWFYGYRRQ